MASTSAICILFLWLATICTAQVNMSSFPGVGLRDYNNEVCSTRGDCCAKAKATMRYLITGALTTTSVPRGGALYPKCPKYYTYVAASDSCQLFRPYREPLEDVPFQDIDDCFDRLFEDPESLGASAGPGFSLDRNMNCLQAFYDAHERCLYETFSQCATGIAPETECADDYVLFTDWDSDDNVVDGYPDTVTISSSPSPF